MNGVKSVNVYASNIKGILFPRDCIRFTVCRFAFDTPTQRDIIIHTVLAVQIISVVLTPSSILWLSLLNTWLTLQCSPYSVLVTDAGSSSGGDHLTAAVVRGYCCYTSIAGIIFFLVGPPSNMWICHSMSKCMIFGAITSSFFATCTFFFCWLACWFQDGMIWNLDSVLFCLHLLLFYIVHWRFLLFFVDYFERCFQLLVEIYVFFFWLAY